MTGHSVQEKEGVKKTAEIISPSLLTASNQG
jgi:hypothetical protein